MSHVTQFQSGETAYLNGKSVRVISPEANCIVVEDAQGNRLSVRKNALKAIPLFNFYSDESIKERKEQIAYYQELGHKAKKEKQGFLAQVKDFWAQLNLLDKSDKNYKILKDKYWAARMDKTAAGNREYSAYLHAAMIASDPIA